MTTLAASTTATVPWWYVAALAGGFTIFGALVTLTGVVITARRKNRLDDSRRFDADVIEGYVMMDKAVDVMHNNIGETKEDNDAWWDTYRAVLNTVSKLQLITTSEISDIAGRMSALMGSMAPRIGNAYVMPELVDSLEELRHAIRARLRIAKMPKEDIGSRGPRGWLLWMRWRIEERRYARASKAVAPVAATPKLPVQQDEIPWPDEPPYEDEPPD